jgi:anti-sigma B factor antagonist
MVVRRMQPVQGDPQSVTVAPTGDIDLATVGQVENMITEAIRTAGAAKVVVNLSGVEFMDSSGVSMLLRSFRLAEEHRVPFSVVDATGIVRQVLDMTGVWNHLSGQSVDS